MQINCTQSNQQWDCDVSGRCNDGKKERPFNTHSCHQPWRSQPRRLEHEGESRLIRSRLSWSGFMSKNLSFKRSNWNSYGCNLIFTRNSSCFNKDCHHIQSVHITRLLSSLRNNLKHWSLKPSPILFWSKTCRLLPHNRRFLKLPKNTVTASTLWNPWGSVHSTLKMWLVLEWLTLTLVASLTAAFLECQRVLSSIG